MAGALGRRGARAAACSRTRSRRHPVRASIRSRAVCAASRRLSSRTSCPAGRERVMPSSSRNVPLRTRVRVGSGSSGGTPVDALRCGLGRDRFIWVPIGTRVYTRESFDSFASEPKRGIPSPGHPGREKQSARTGSSCKLHEGRGSQPGRGKWGRLLGRHPDVCFRFAVDPEKRRVRFDRRASCVPCVVKKPLVERVQV